MTSTPYALTFNTPILSHNKAVNWLLRDQENKRNIETDALVASGDCFVTLATMLDQLHHTLEDSGEGLQPELEKVITILLYLQRHYTVIHKFPNYRQ